MISDLALARAAFAQSRTAADALLTTATADLKLANAPLEATDTAEKTGGEPDVAAAEQTVLDTFTANAVDKSA
jgi:hypothetical protein